MRARIVALVVLLMLALPFAAPFARAQGGDVTYPTTQWHTSTPEEQGVDSVQLLAALDFVAERALALDSITVIRHGSVVLDAYFHPYTADRPHQLWYANDQILVTLAGIAIDQGLIEGLDQPVLSFFPDREIANLSGSKEAMTVGNLLTTSTGFTCAWDWETVLQAPDTLGRFLDLPVSSRPGAAHEWCELNRFVLAGVLETAAGMPLLDWADQVFFGPLGITDYRWQILPDGLPAGWSSLYMTPRDLARLGYLYLQGGQWAGQQIVSPEWIALVTCADPAACPFYENVAGVMGNVTGIARTIGAGYLWYLYHPYFYGSFWYTGQYLAVAPERDMVVVVTFDGGADPVQTAGTIPFDLIGERLLAAAGQEDPLPANPDAVAALEARVAALAQPVAQPVVELPAKVAALSGVDYVLGPVINWCPGVLTSWCEYFYGWGTIDGFKLTFDRPDEATLELVFSDGRRVTLAVGLDGIARVTETEMGTFAAVSTGATGMGLTLKITLLGAGELRNMTLGFMGNTVMLISSDPLNELSSNATARPHE